MDDNSQSNSKLQLVVSRYNENVEWTRLFKNVIIYNKGAPLGNGFNERFLPNVGREGHTFYKHICENYDNLCDYTAFLQGNPFDHERNIIQILLDYEKNPPSGFQHLASSIFHTTIDEEKRTYPNHFQNLQEGYKHVFGFYPCENCECIFGAGGQFICSRENILKNDKSFYDNIVKMLDKDSNPIEGHYIERFHKYIICGPVTNKIST